MELINDTICAPATGSARGGISIIRVSGRRALEAVSVLYGAQAFRPASPLLEAGRENAGREARTPQASHTVRLATLCDSEGIIDQALITYFAAPRSYTGEDVAEISVHASAYIVDRILQALSVQGVRMAAPGEFTQRAFLNGKMDLSQAEAVADLIASENRATHDIALKQLRGGFSHEIENLRTKLLEFVSLVELELDFGEEDVEFADRTHLKFLLAEISNKVEHLRQSFQVGNALKEGIPVAIIGKPNAGKSTLLNLLLHEDRALVSDIPGTTRDTIEEIWQIDGVKFRFIDTAGLRESGDTVEKMGIERTLEKMRSARVWLYVFDASTENEEQARADLSTWRADVFARIPPSPQGSPVSIIVANKIDRLEAASPYGVRTSRSASSVHAAPAPICLSAQTGQGLEDLQNALRALIPALPGDDSVVLTNARHYEALGLVQQDLQKIFEGLDTNLPGDLLSIDIHSAIDHLGLITGKIITDDILGTVFSKFCIGK